jgi:ribosomal protein S27AE
MQDDAMKHGCPKCGSIEIIIAGDAEAKLHAVLVPVADDPVKILRIEPTGYCEWRADTWAECARCGHTVALSEFDPPIAMGEDYVGED